MKIAFSVFTISMLAASASVFAEAQALTGIPYSKNLIPPTAISDPSARCSSFSR